MPMKLNDFTVPLTNLDLKASPLQFGHVKYKSFFQKPIFLLPNII